MRRLLADDQEARLFQQLISRIHKGSLRLFRVAGIDVSLHWTWLLVALFQFQGGVMAYSSPVWHVVEYVALFGIVLLHEFGHVLACRQVGGTANQIVLWPLGGIALVSPPPRPEALLWTIAAGPLVNVVLVPITLGMVLLAVFARFKQWAPDFDQFLLAIAVLNFLLLVFNMLPIYPLDGGQILHALLWFVIGRVPSLLVVTPIGLVAGISVAALALWSREPWSALVGLLVIVGCLAGMRRSLVLLRMAKAQRREEKVCPSCGKTAPVGTFWKCDRCWAVLDAFGAAAVCPKCGERLSMIHCPECGAQHAFYDWSPMESAAVAEAASTGASLSSGSLPVMAEAEGSLNAATHYRRAFALLPRLCASEMRILQDALTTPLNKITSRLIERSEPALEALYRGAVSGTCDWELHSPKQLQELIDLAVPVRRLCDLGCLSARRAFEQGDGRAALGVLADLLVLARHYGRDGGPINRRMQSTVELFTTSLAAGHLLEQDPPTLQAFTARLASLPQPGTLAQMVHNEMEYLLQVVRPKFEAKSREEAFAVLRMGMSTSQAEAIWMAAGRETAGFIRLIDNAAVYCDELGSIVMLSGDAARRALTEFAKDHQSSNPLLALEARGFDSLLPVVGSGHMRVNMLRTAVGIVAEDNWQEAARDPSRTDPLECECFAAGFELKLPSVFADQPTITLLVGKKPGIVERLSRSVRRWIG